MKEVSNAEESERREGASEEKVLKAKKRRGQEIKRAKGGGGGTRKDKMYKSDVREEGRGRDLLEERLSQVVPGQSLIRFKSN